MTSTPNFKKVDITRAFNSSSDTQTVSLTVTFDQTVHLRSGVVPLVSIIDYKNLSPSSDLHLVSSTGSSFTYQFLARPDDKFFLEIFPGSIESTQGLKGDLKPFQFNISFPQALNTGVQIEELTQNFSSQFQSKNEAVTFNRVQLSPSNFDNQKIAVIEWAGDGNESSITDKEIQDLIKHIKSAGYTAVTFDAYIPVKENGKSITSLANDSNYVRMFAAIDYAKEVGLNTGVHCYFNVNNTSVPISPSSVGADFDVQSFFNGLDKFYKDVSGLLQNHGVSLFILGSDMQQLVTAQYHDNWAKLVSTIRNSFKGIVTYDASLEGANASPDHTNSWLDKVGIWDLMDVIGVAFSGQLSASPLMDEAAITKQLYSGSIYGNNFTTQLFELSKKYQKKIFLDSIISWNSSTEGLLFGRDSDSNKIFGGDFHTDTLLQVKAYQAILDWINNNLYPIVTSYGIQGYHPWVYSNFDLANGATTETAGWEARKLIQTLAGATTEYLGTLTESEIVKYLNSDSTYHLNNVLTGGSGNDIFYTRSGENFIYLNGGNDQVNGGVGKDHIFASNETKVLSLSINSWFTKSNVQSNQISLLINDSIVQKILLTAVADMLAKYPDGYWSSSQTFDVDLSKFQNITSIKFLADGGLNQINGITLNGLSLDPSPNNANKDGAGNLQPYWITANNSASFNLPSGYSIQSPHESVVSGGGGVDDFSFSLPRSSYVISKTDSNLVVGETAKPDKFFISSVERLIFKDVSIAFDLDGNAGVVTKLLGAIFGKNSITNKNYLGIGLYFMDAGWTYDNLAGLALEAAGVKTNDQVVSLLWTNVIGSKPSTEDKAPFIQLLENGMSAASLAHLAAETIVNTNNINLVGLSQTGIEYLPLS